MFIRIKGETQTLILNGAYNQICNILELGDFTSRVFMDKVQPMDDTSYYYYYIIIISY